MTGNYNKDIVNKRKIYTVLAFQVGLKISSISCFLVC